MDCGCPEEAALWDFYLWKTMTATNEDGIIEGLMTQRIDPRMHLFIIGLYSRGTALTLDDLYTHNESAEVFEKRIIETQIRRLKHRLHLIVRPKKQGKYQCSPQPLQLMEVTAIPRIESDSNAEGESDSDASGKGKSDAGSDSEGESGSE
jgi:hypothetical protein